jgi:two-component system, chemotaxis family, sensor kinase Cph1
MDISETWASKAKPWVNQISNDPVDLTHCDREQVQFPGAIMPHGVLLILSLNDFRIQGASENTLVWFGNDVAQLLQGHLDLIVTPHIRQILEKSLNLITDSQLPRYLGSFLTLQNRHRFDVFAHRSGNVFIVEFEAIPTELSENGSTGLIAEITDCISKLHAAETWQDGMAIGVRELKRLTGFDSVVGARFLDDGSFHAIAEACETHFPSVLDKRFPRSDIPESARRQMVLMPLQYALDLDYEPVPIIIADQTHNPLQIDLGLAVLRSISPMCRRFYQNMGVQSRLVIALVDQGELWGFFSFKNALPRRVSYSDRMAFKLFAEMSALLLVEKERSEQFQAALQVKQRMSKIAAKLSSADVIPVALSQLPEQLLNNLDVTGVALCLDNRILCAGITPETTVIQALILWLDEQNQPLFITDRLQTLFKTTAYSLDQLTGLLAVQLKKPGQYLLCFRPEIVQEVNWAGDPLKQIEIDAISGEERFTPRGSFEVWKQEMRGTARAWQLYETEAITDLQHTIIRLQYSEKQRILQACLEQSNTDLEAFAYIVSHDLQEPLRGICNFSQMLMDSTNEQLKQQELNWLKAIVKLGDRMSHQINALLQYSRASQQALENQLVDFNLLVSNVLEDLSATIKNTETQIEIPQILPTLICDRIRLTSVFSNLITNAIKYNDQPEKQIEIGCLENPTLTFFVRDNGIGIPEKFHDAIFTIFRRLHGRNEYGGGTGAGLAIARKHIEKHNGRLWLESIPGQGATFYFTLGSDLSNSAGSADGVVSEATAQTPQKSVKPF